MNESRDCKLSGDVIALVQIGEKPFAHERIVKVCVEVDATYTSDWQEDGGYYHDEGDYDYDLSKATLFDDYYEDVNTFGFKEGRWGKITKIIKIFDENLQESA